MGVREERIILAGEELELTLAGATWIYPNGGGAGFYRFALDDGANAQARIRSRDRPRTRGASELDR